MLQLLLFLKDSKERWTNIKTYFNNSFTDVDKNSYDDYLEFFKKHDLTKQMTGRETYFQRITQNGKSITLKEINNLIEIDKGKRPLKETHPFLSELRTIIITAVITGAITGYISIIVLRYQNQSVTQSKYLIDKRQDSVLKELSDSLHILQMHK